MQRGRKRAYRVLLAAAMLHTKWDLGGWYGKPSWLPWIARQDAQAAHRAAMRAVAFHNLAIFAARDFAGFEEEWFWTGVDSLAREFGDVPYGNYRVLFEQALRGAVNIVAPA